MSELTFCLERNEAVDTCHALWVVMVVPMMQAPCEMDFGTTFVALTPDGHRLRVFTSNGQLADNVQLLTQFHACLPSHPTIMQPVPFQPV